ncbi:MAG: pantetheine-phosphate adenylyltransferase [Clostridiaceae bacterium]|nr:pantetheine-phosphate adenylyltransferase [Clostridiaceae bacterium]
MKLLVYPGSFDPVTNGHMDIIERASKICDKLIVAVLVNHSKTSTFTMEERIRMLKEAIGDRKNIEVHSFSGLLVDFMRSVNAKTIIKGLRAVSDFEYEMQMALLNRKLDNEIDTLFMMTSIDNCFLSSSVVRELARIGAGIEDYVPHSIAPYIYEKFKRRVAE